MIPLLLQKVAAKNHRIFLSGAWNVNVIGIRRTDDPNRFDDTLALVYRDDDLSWVTREFACTTDPGTYWLRNPGRIEGTAALVPGQYLGVYKIDKHAGRYDALCQRLGPVRVWRDADKDGEFDWTAVEGDGKPGWYGINIHRASITRTAPTVDRWSAGCTVIQAHDDFEVFMRIIRKSAEGWGNKFTYTLMEEKDV